jgi:hypothetical protein
MIISQDGGRRLPSVLLSAIDKIFMPNRPYGRNRLTRFLHREHRGASSLEQVMIPHQAMMKDALSLHPPPPLPTDADATVTGTDIAYLADLQPQLVEWLWPPGGQTQGSIEIAAERDGVCIATLRRAKFDIGVRSSKDGKSGAWWWTLPPLDD